MTNNSTDTPKAAKPKLTRESYDEDWNMKTDTPRTDAVEPQLHSNVGGWVRADFARQLERELTHSLENQVKSQAQSHGLARRVVEAEMKLEVSQAEVERLHGLLNRAIELANWFADGYEPLSKEQESRYDGMCANLSALKGNLKGLLTS